jgi:glyoxylase-like metal-dependent hydrolase (beta-lactamase superfamily II)
MTLVPLPAFADNYIWMLQDGSNAIVVDPGDAQPVFDALTRDNLQLAAILVTHHLHDHTGGVEALHAATGARVFGPTRESIPDALAALPGDTRVCCAHEYTLVNLGFAYAVEPGNTDLTHYTARCESLRAQGQPTLPSQLATERRINPFLRSREATVLRAVREHAELSANAAEADVFAALRQWKNDFR